MKIPFSPPSISKQEIKSVVKVLKSNWITTGKYCLKFEQDFASYVGCKFAYAVSSATAGLHIALLSLEIQENDYVITTPMTFVSTAEVIQYQKAIPLFADIEKNSMNIDPKKVEELLIKYGKKVKAIIAVHIAGSSCNMNELISLSKKYCVPIIEDAAHSVTGKFENKFQGTIGEIGVFSFYATKTITTGEGGMVVTNDSNIAKKIEIFRLHGINRNVWDRYSSSNSNWEYDITELGYKYNLTDIQAAIGIEQLKKANKMKLQREKIFLKYNKAFENLPNIITPKYDKESSFHLYIVEIENDLRDTFYKKLAEKGICCSVHYKPLHLMTYYKNKFNYTPEDYPNATNKFKTILSLPLFSKMKKNEVNFVIEIFKKISYNKI